MTEQYQNLLKSVINNGDVFYEPRTKQQVMGISSFVSTYDLRKGFPNLTTKNVPPRLPFEELFWKLRGERNVKGLVDKNVNIWTANAFDRYLRNNNLEEKVPKNTPEWNNEFQNYSEKIKNDSEFAKVAGDLGPVYGFQWRHWKNSEGEETDQLRNVINGIKNNPGSRYHILNAWNPGELKKMALGPCPFWHQFSVYGNSLDLTMVQRSNDTFLGDPFNQAQDALLLEMMAKETGLEARFFHHHTINTHIYLGVSPRSNFWKEEKNFEEFKKRFGEVKEREGYLKLKEWYLENTESESEGNEKKDHMPFVLEQLSYEPKKSPILEFKVDVPLLEAIEMPVTEVAELINYNPHKWKSKAIMAA